MLVVVCLPLRCQHIFFGLAKILAAWDGGTVRSLTPNNKDSEKRSLLSFYYFYYFLRF